jgi:hypothetical protein
VIGHNTLKNFLIDSFPVGHAIHSRIADNTKVFSTVIAMTSKPLLGLNH